jgi:SH3 domain-containing YSC84-like protein 1
MRARIFSIVAILLVAYLATAAHASMQDDVDQAVTIIERFQEIPEKAIPTAVMREAKGLAILNVTKAGFIITGRGGTGDCRCANRKGLERSFGNWYGRNRIWLSGWGSGLRACNRAQHSGGC